MLPRLETLKAASSIVGSTGIAFNTSQDIGCPLLIVRVLVALYLTCRRTYAGAEATLCPGELRQGRPGVLGDGEGEWASWARSAPP